MKLPNKSKVNLGSGSNSLPVATDHSKTSTVSLPNRSEELEPREEEVTNASSPVAVTSSSPPKDVNAEEFQHPTQLDGYTEEQVENFRNHFKIIKDNIEDVDLVKDAIRNVMLLLKENPTFDKILFPEDIGLMVRHIRMAYGRAIQKSETRNKKKTEKKQRVNKISAKMDQLIGMDLGDI